MNSDHEQSLDHALYKAGSYVAYGAIITGVVYIIASPLGAVLALCDVKHPFATAGDLLLRTIAVIALIVSIMMCIFIVAIMFGKTEIVGMLMKWFVSPLISLIAGLVHAILG